MSTMAMGSKLAESMLDLENGNGAEVNKFDNIG
jgi:hypothetical protein